MNFIPLAALIILFFLERVFPHHKSLDNNILHTLSNLSLAIINLVITGLFYLWCFHPIELILFSMANALVLALSGIKFEYFFIYKFLMQPIIIFHHSNLNLPEKYDRFFRFLFVTPNMHRVHHHRYKNETNTNFSTIFSVWDRVFGTFKKNNNVYNIEYGLNSFRDKKWQGIFD